jgi:hypothetical protein
MMRTSTKKYNNSENFTWREEEATQQELELKVKYCETNACIH